MFSKIKNTFLAFVCLGSSLIYGAEQNHYWLGTNTINSALKPREGFVYNNIFDYYHASDLKNSHGKNVDISGSVDIKTDLNIFSWYPGACVFCGSYGCQAIIPFTTGTTEFPFNLSPDFPFDFLVLEGGNNQLRLGDIYIEPINITWRTDRLALLASYGFYIPTGQFQPFSEKDSGYGNWGHQVAFATTYFLDPAKTFTFSAYVAYEIHCRKKDIDYTPGDNLIVDWGLGKTICGCVTVGLVGYVECMTTNDSGTQVPPALKGVKDRVFAIGPELDFEIDEIGGLLTMRYEREFLARARTQGNRAIASLGVRF